MSEKPNLAVTISVMLVGVFLITPSVIVIIMSFSGGSTLHFPPPSLGVQGYRNFIESREWTSALRTSVVVGLSSSALATMLGTTTALAIVRGRFPFKGVVAGFMLSPLIVPVVIVAIGMYMTYSQWGLQGTVLGMVLAHTALGLPFVVVNVMASLKMLDRNLELAANSLGAGPIRTFIRVTLPLILPGVVAGALFAFILSWDEVVAAIFLTSPFVKTLPVVMWSVIRTQMDPTIAAVAALLTAASVLLFVSVILTRKLGSRNS